MPKYIHNFLSSNKSHRARSKPPKVVKLGTYVSFFIVSFIVFPTSKTIGFRPNLTKWLIHNIEENPVPATIIFIKSNLY